MLGISTAWIENLAATAAEMVYGQTIMVPRELLIARQSPVAPEPENYVQQLRRFFQAIWLTSTSNHSREAAFVFTALDKATHVFVRRDGVPRPL